jgi:hypothetical protein
MLVVAKADQFTQTSADLNVRMCVEVERALGHRREHITRVEIRVIDELIETDAGDHQMCCSIEAKLEHRPPVAVMHRAWSRSDAVSGATSRLIRMVDEALS